MLPQPEETIWYTIQYREPNSRGEFRGAPRSEQWWDYKAGKAYTDRAEAAEVALNVERKTYTLYRIIKHVHSSAVIYQENAQAVANLYAEER